MEGRRKARDAEAETVYFGAWATERFAREKKLKRFGQYIADLRPKRAQTTADMLTIFEGMEAAGIPMKIKKVG